MVPAASIPFTGFAATRPVKAVRTCVSRYGLSDVHGKQPGRKRGFGSPVPSRPQPAAFSVVQESAVTRLHDRSVLILCNRREMVVCGSCHGLDVAGRASTTSCCTRLGEGGRMFQQLSSQCCRSPVSMLPSSARIQSPISGPSQC